MGPLPRFIDYKNLRSNNNHAKTSNTRVLWEKETKQDQKNKRNSATVINQVITDKIKI
jgi:hypothetical protein